MSPSSNTDAASLADKKKGKYLTKVVKFGKENLTLYSLDGNTWSSRRQELTDIANRHEQERLKSIQAMGEGIEAEKGAEAEEEKEEKEEKEESAEQELEDDIDPEVDLGDLEDDEELLLDEEEAPKKKGAKKASSPPPAAAKSKAKSPPKSGAKPAVSKPVAAAPKTSPKKKPAKGKR